MKEGSRSLASWIPAEEVVRAGFLSLGGEGRILGLTYHLLRHTFPNPPLALFPGTIP